MALTRCPDCERDISDAAVSCPHCGRPNRRPTLADEHAARMSQNAPRMEVDSSGALRPAKGGIGTVPKALLGLLAALVALRACGGFGSSSQRSATSVTSGSSAPIQPAPLDTLSGNRFLIPSDPKATFYELERSGTKSKPVLFTKRVGPSGTTYSKRVFDCGNHTFKYLGSGETPQQMEQSKADAEMHELVEGSIADVIWHRACRK